MKGTNKRLIRKHLPQFLPLVILASILTVVSQEAFSQSTDKELWTGAGIRYDINRRFRMDIEQECRWKDQMGTFKFTYTEVGIRWRINRIFSIRGKYRYLFVPDDYDGGKFYLDGNVDLSKKRFPLSISYRLRYERGNEFVVSKMENWLRNQFEINWNMSKIADPYLGWENFRRLDGINEARANRYSFGIDWRLSKIISLSSFYIFEDEFNVKKPLDRHIIGLRLTYRFRNKEIVPE